MPFCRHTSRQEFSLRKDRGSIILFVLGLVLLTSLLLTRFIARAHTELLTDARRSQMEPLRDEAYSALQVSLAVLADFSSIDQGLHAPAQGWGEPLIHADYSTSVGFETEVTIEDETGKLSLANADPTAFHNLLLTLDFLPSEADRIVDAILAWTNAEYPAQYTESLTLKNQTALPELNPPHEELRSFAELKLIPIFRQLMCDDNGNWNGAGLRFLDSVSLYKVNQINLNSAGPDVLNALGLDGDSITSSREQLNGDASQYYSSLADVGAISDQVSGSTQIGVDALLLRIHVTSKFGGRKFQLTADVQRGGRSTSSSLNTDNTESTVEPRPWTRNSIDSGFRILEIRENNGY